MIPLTQARIETTSLPYPCLLHLKPPYLPSACLPDQGDGRAWRELDFGARILALSFPAL